MTTITSAINFNTGDEMESNKLWPIDENKITTPILMVLFATNKVASNFLGFSIKERMILAFTGFSCETSSRSAGVNEKKATSAAETNAEQKSNIKITTKPNTILKSMVDKKCKLGSGSKLIQVS